MQVNSVIDAINQTTSGQTSGATSAAGFKSADFMQMLMAQLTHQNPLEPLNDSEMMNQFTQLNSLQALQQIQTSMQKVLEDSQSAFASSLMGKMVTISLADGATAEGKVTGFSTESGKIFLQVDDASYALDEVARVWEEPVNG